MTWRFHTFDVDLDHATLPNPTRCLQGDLWDPAPNVQPRVPQYRSNQDPAGPNKTRPTARSTFQQSSLDDTLSCCCHRRGSGVRALDWQCQPRRRRVSLNGCLCHATLERPTRCAMTSRNTNLPIIRTTEMERVNGTPRHCLANAGCDTACPGQRVDVALVIATVCCHRHGCQVTPSHFPNVEPYHKKRRV